MKNIKMLMQEYDRFDCDPADCADRKETETESAKEFTSVPDEFGSEQATEFGAAETERDFFNSPGIIAPLGMTASELTQDERKTDLSSLCETSDENDGDGKKCGCGYTDNSAETAEEYGDPDGETAAVDGEADFDEPSADYTTEASDDCGDGDGKKCGCGCGDGKECGCGYSDNSAETAEEYGVDLAENETAACDDRTFSAQERCSLDDYEIISDVLGNEKQLVKLYSTALCESAEEPLRNIIRENLVECADDQYATFEYMEKRGLYPTEEAPVDKITEAKQQFGPLCR